MVREMIRPKGTPIIAVISMVIESLDALCMCVVGRTGRFLLLRIWVTAHTLRCLCDLLLHSPQGHSGTYHIRCLSNGLLPAACLEIVETTRDPNLTLTLSLKNRDPIDKLVGWSE